MKFKKCSKNPPADGLIKFRKFEHDLDIDTGLIKESVEFFKKNPALEVIHISVISEKASSHKTPFFVSNLTFYIRRERGKIICGFQASFKGYIKKSTFINKSPKFHYRWNNNVKRITITNFVDSTDALTLTESAEELMDKVKSFQFLYLS